MKRHFSLAAAIGAGALLAAGGVALANGNDGFGLFRDAQLANRSPQLFGVGMPLPSSSTKQLTKAQAKADPTKLVTLAKGLTAHVVTSQGGFESDQISFWPNAQHPTTLIACNESDPSEIGLERIDIATGKATTIVTGTESCDPTRLTPWGTIVFGEEDGGGPNGGRMYELIDPLHASTRPAQQLRGHLSEGVPSGVVAEDGPVRCEEGREGTCSLPTKRREPVGLREPSSAIPLAPGTGLSA